MPIPLNQPPSLRSQNRSAASSLAKVAKSNFLLLCLQTLSLTLGAQEPSVLKDAHPPPVDQLLPGLQEHADLIPWCREFFARSWHLSNSIGVTAREVTASAAVRLEGDSLLVEQKKDGSRIPLQIGLLAGSDQVELHHFVQYAAACARAREQWLASNKGDSLWQWTGRDGVTRKGEIQHFLLRPEGQPPTGSVPEAVSFVAIPPGGKQAALVPWHSLSAESRIALLDAIGKIEAHATETPARTLPDAPRDQIPSFNQADFKGGRSENCGPNAVADFIVWWDRIKLLELPISGKRDELQKAEWVHERLFGVMRSGGGTSIPALCQGIEAFFSRYYPGRPSPRFLALGNPHGFRGPTKPLTIASVAEHTRGVRATILNISQTKDGRKHEGHYVALATADPDGNLLLNTWGIQFRGKLKQLTNEDIRALPPRVHSYNGSGDDSFEIILANSTAAMEREKRRWFILPGDGLLIVDP